MLGIAAQPRTPRLRWPVCSEVVPQRHRIEALASSSDLAEASSFFVEAFWTAGTTFGKVVLSGREKKQLAKRMSQDFEERYGNSWSGRQRLFPSRLLVARQDEEDVGLSDGIVAIAGVEAALLNPFTRQVLTSAESEMLLRSELDAMSGPDYSTFSKLSRAEMVRQLYPEYQLLGLLTNLAVAPSLRRQGLARALCRSCDDACRSWRLSGLLLQVEEPNTAALRLYTSQLGFEELWRDCDATALRLVPGASSVASSLLMLESEDLLQSEPSTIVTLARAVTAGDEQAADR